MKVPHSASEARRILGSYGLSPRKKFGQNFLTDESLLSEIVDAADVDKSDIILEIGPGMGTLTAQLAQRAGRVVALEIDKGLIPLLTDVLSEYDNVSVINCDVMKSDIRQILSDPQICGDFAGASSFKVVANLPYYITTPIMMYLLEEDLAFDSITVMVQREVADRMCAQAGSREYGALSLAVAYYTKPEIMIEVPPESFTPPPAVDSAVVRLTRLPEAPVSCARQALFSLIRASFNQRRKTLVNALAGGGVCGGDKEAIRAALSELGLPENVRGEQLSLEQFSDLGQQLFK